MKPSTSTLIYDLTGLSTVVEPATSPRSSSMSTPKALRRRKKGKLSGEASTSSSISLIDIEGSDRSKGNESTAEESGDKPNACLDSIREFGKSCAVYFEEVANNMIDYFNEISEDYRAIAEQLEREWTLKYREHLKNVQERRESKDPAESNGSAEGDKSMKFGKVGIYVRSLVDRIADEPI